MVPKKEIRGLAGPDRTLNASLGFQICIFNGGVH